MKAQAEQLQRARDDLSRALAEAERAAELLEHGDAFLELDAGWRILRVNANQERMSGKPRSESVGRVLWEVWPDVADPLRRFSAEYHRCMEERVPVQFEDYFEPLDMWTAITAYPTSGGGIAIFLRDITERRRAAQAMQSEHAFISAVLDTVVNVVIVLDGEGRIVRLNAACERLTGYTAAELIGRHIFEVLIPQEDLPGVRATFGQLRAGQFPNQHQNRWRTKAGAERWLEFNNTCITDDRGDVKFVIGTAIDITERRLQEERLRESAERFQTLADHIAQFAWIADETGSIFWYNRRWYDYTGTTLDEMKGWGWQKVHHPEHVERVTEKFRRAVEAGEEWEDTFPLRGRDGSYRWFLSRAIPIRDEAGRVIRWFGTNTDVTEQRDAQEALREIDRRRTEFLGVLSHELRNPLAPIRNSIYLLEKVPPGSEVAARSREVIRRQTEHLARLVDDLLDVTRISRGKVQLHRERLDLRNVVRATCEDLRVLFEDAGIELNLDFPAAPVWAEVDPTRIAQVVGNLLQNAAKFTPRRGRVTVRLRGRDEQAEISVQDTGVGIEPAQFAVMFEPFAQEDRSLARTRGGLGLGLALSKGLVELHGGTIRAQSAGAGSGSEFTMTLPLAPAPARPAAESPSAREPRGSHRRILIIEDNTDAARTLAAVLELDGHEVSIARSGLEGLALARELKPDVVVCDLGLPDIDGYEVARRIRADESLRGARLFALSGYAQPEDRERAREAGFESHLSKPAPLEQLVAMLGA